MVLVTRLSRFLIRNVRTSLRTSTRHFDSEAGGEEIKSTTVTMLNKEDDDYLYVEAYSQIGFKLNNGFRVIGPCVLFPRSILHWGIGGTHELNEESLSLFPLLFPKLDILVLGIGDHGAKYDKNIYRFLRANKINVEILPTDQACTTFNFLNAERRLVAAALVPPTYMHLDSDEDLLVRARLEAQENVFEMKRDDTSTPGEFAHLLETAEEQIYPHFGINAKKRKGKSDKADKTDEKKDNSGTDKEKS